MNQKCITRLTAQTMHFMLHNTDCVYSSISTDDCRGFWNSCTLYLPVQHTGTYANIHPICSPFLCIRQPYKSPLDLDRAICSGVCGTETGLSPSKHAVDSLLFAIAFCGVWSGSLREGGSRARRGGRRMYKEYI